MSQKAQYKERDIEHLDEIGGFYCLHVDAMTREALHDKSDIAAELAYRDAEIEKLKTENAELFRKWSASQSVRERDLQQRVYDRQQENEQLKAENGNLTDIILGEYGDEVDLIKERDRLFARCKIVFYPAGGQYPIEHNMSANKDSRSLIEEALNQTEPLPAHPGCCDICDTGGCCKAESEEE